MALASEALLLVGLERRDDVGAIEAKSLTPHDQLVAGDPLSAVTNKCQLKPLNRGDDYGPLGLTDTQWEAMQKIFPDGVCDFSKPPVGYQPTVAWLTYQKADGKVIYGGEPLPAELELRYPLIVKPRCRRTLGKDRLIALANCSLKAASAAKQLTPVNGTSNLGNSGDASMSCCTNSEATTTSPT